MRKTIVCILASTVFFISAFASAQETREGGLVIPDSVPDEYIIKKGDTLWDISGMFLGNPFDWPEIWKRNDYIKDPHWIYPGQKLIFRDGKLEIVEAPVVEEGLKVPVAPLPKPEPRFTPLILKDAPEQKAETQRQPAPRMTAAPVMETASIRADETGVLRSLQSPREVYTIQSYMRTGFIAKRADIPRSTVSFLENGHANAIRYDYIIVEPSRGVRFREGDILSVLALGDRVKHPDTGVDMGVVLRVKGILQVESVTDGNARCQITENFDPIRVNDLVMHARLRESPVFDAWISPEKTIRGVVLARNEIILSVHLSDILYIDKGSNDGVCPGDRFLVYSREDDKTDADSRHPIGEVEAVNVMANETAVLVVSLSDRSLNIGDRVELSARCRIVE